MNPWQLALQIRHELQTVTWPTGSAELVFGPRNVVVYTDDLPEEAQIPLAFPWCLVGVSDGEPDEDDPGLILQNYNLTPAVNVRGDRMGQSAVAGGAAPDLGKSAGRGVMEVDAMVRSAVEGLTGFDGAALLLSDTSLGGPRALTGKHLAMSSLTLTGLCTSALFYAPPQQLVYSGGTWSWEGTHCAARFDFLQYRLVSKAGTSPSTDPSDGTVVYTGATPSFVGAASGGNTYTAFADYDARGKGTVDGSSSPEVGSYRVV